MDDVDLIERRLVLAELASDSLLPVLGGSRLTITRLHVAILALDSAHGSTGANLSKLGVGLAASLLHLLLDLPLPVHF